VGSVLSSLPWVYDITPSVVGFCAGPVAPTNSLILLWADGGFEFLKTGLNLIVLSSK